MYKKYRLLGSLHKVTQQKLNNGIIIIKPKILIQGWRELRRE